MEYIDLTIVIPIRIDSSDRLRNIHLVIDSLKKFNGIEIIILEADKQSLLEDIEGVRIIFVEDDNPLFYRTKYINQLCHLTDRPLLGIWDSDVIIPAEQLDKSLYLLRLAVVDMVYPYDGRFLNVSGQYLDQFIQTKDDNSLVENIFSIPCAYGKRSCGGAFLVNRKAYIEAGGENEKFKGWGPEDLERYKRWEIKGYNVDRVDGALYHLNHYMGLNSRYLNSETRKAALRTLLETCRGVF